MLLLLKSKIEFTNKFRILLFYNFFRKNTLHLTYRGYLTKEIVIIALVLSIYFKKFLILS